MTKIVLDTNVVVSGLLSRGAPSRIFDFARDGKITLCSSPLLIAELGRVLTYPRLSSYLDRRGVTVEQLILAYEKASRIRLDIVLPGKIAADPNDKVILGCALAHSAEYIISGDTHLLALKSFASVKIIEAARFVFEMR